MRVFQTYKSPDLYAVSSIYCSFSISGQNRVNAFYRLCLRLIYCTYRVSTTDLHNVFKLPLLTEKCQKSQQKKINNIQMYGNEMLICILLHKNVINEIQHHYTEKSFIKGLPNGRPNKRITSLAQNDNLSFCDKLCNFIWTE